MSYPGGGATGDDVYGTTPLVTGDAVVLELRPAGFVTRIAAMAIDGILQIVMIIMVTVVMMWVGTSLDTAATAALGLALPVLIIVGYPTAFETISRGRTLGKMALGLRVVGTDGSPVRFRQALGRALSASVEIWASSGLIALLTSMINPNGRRVGDFVAGTMVVEERTGSRRDVEIPMPPQMAAWAAAAELSRLAPETANAARQYVMRYGELAEHTRHEMGSRLADSVASQVSPPPPPGTTPPVFLAAVLAERRRRSLESLRGASARRSPWEGAPHAPGQWSAYQGGPQGPGGTTPPPPPYGR